MTAGRVEGAARRGRRRFAPVTRPGRWAVRLGVAYVVLVLGWRLLGPLGGFPGLLAGLAGGALAVYAIVRRGERALAVQLAALPLVLVVLFVALELLVGHE